MIIGIDYIERKLKYHKRKSANYWANFYGYRGYLRHKTTSQKKAMYHTCCAASLEEFLRKQKQLIKK